METLILPLGDLAKCAENDSEQSERLSSLLSSFAPSHEDSGEKAFLSHKALAFERLSKARTFLVMLDGQFAGFFSLAIKTLELCGLSKTMRKKLMAGDSMNENTSAFLIGHLARSINSPKGFGARLLDLAMEYIGQARQIVGGRLAYLDCKDNSKLRAYYENKGFSFLQKSPNTELLQYYMVL